MRLEFQGKARYDWEDEVVFLLQREPRSGVLQFAAIPVVRLFWRRLAAGEQKILVDMAPGDRL